VVDALNIRAVVEAAVREITPGVTSPVDFSRSAVDNGVDSLALLVLRESLERSMSVHITDDEWLGFDTLEDVVGFLQRTSASRPGAGPAPIGEPGIPVTGASGPAGPILRPDGCLYDVIEVGMPMTGRNGLSENALLKWLGHLRWCHISEICGVPSKDVRDEDDQRLYPTFFFVDLWFPAERHTATFQENDRLSATCTMQRFGSSMLDGLTYLCPPDVQTDRSTLPEPHEWVAAGFPVARLSNIFVKQFGGAEWLKKSRPANPGFEKLPEVQIPPDSYSLTKTAQNDGAFEQPPSSYVTLVDAGTRVEYDLVPDRDLNGAGLVYFANYPVFVDICERQVLKQGRFALADSHIDRRSLVRRRSAYLNNASASDRLELDFAIWLENPVLAGSPDPQSAPVRLFVNTRMRRQSDGRLMLVSTSQKVLTGIACGDLPFFQEISAVRA